MRRDTAIEVEGARTHNLKGIDCRVPHGRLTVVTGPSGSGKSSLAFDTIYAESQRRFVESMSTYARQFLEQMERPPVEEIRNVLPSVALEAHNAIRNARATVGSVTEIYDVLRLLYTHLGEVYCPDGHGPARRHTAEETAQELVNGAVGEKFTLVAELVRPQGRADDALRELVRKGFGRRLEAGRAVPVVSTDSWLKKWDPLPIVLGRFRAGGEPGTQLVTTLEDGFRLTGGKILAVGEEASRHFRLALSCTVCGKEFRQPVPALFSFNSPLGACPACQGYGRVIGVDPERVVPNPKLTLKQRPISPWSTPSYADLYEELFAACRANKIPLNVPWEELPEEAREWIWRGKGDFRNLEKFFARLERRNYKVHVRVMLARYRSYDPCPTCKGTRLQPEALGVRLEGLRLPELTAMGVEELRRWVRAKRWSRRQREAAGDVIDQLTHRVEVLHRVGLDYLTLDRQARTLSGGESQRIHLAAALGSGLTSTLYVLDEPTIGLHTRDSKRLLKLLHDLASRGNTVLVVEHDRELIGGADHLIDLGPASGELGGEVVAEGSLATILASEDSVTGRYLRDRSQKQAREHLSRHHREKSHGGELGEIASRPRIRIREASAHNLNGFDVEIPLESLVVVTGVSGSGKSSLIENVLYGNYRRGQGSSDVEPGKCRAVEGLEELADVVLVDQRPLGKSKRSNPVTYVKAYDEIRQLFAATETARRAGIKPAHFSFNLDRGRCPVCQGTGVCEVDMQFMAPVSVTCDECQGHRFREEVLRIRFKSLNIAETLELTVDEALEHFRERPKLCRRLQSLVDAGLGYLRLGQPTSTLSGGEAQRLRLAAFLDRPRRTGATLYIFDEPTTGLHFVDIDVLYQTLRKLVRRGDGVLIVEHSLDLIARADWIVDLGPGGGVRGGDLLYSGALVPFLDGVESPTAKELRRHLGWRRNRSGKRSG